MTTDQQQPGIPNSSVRARLILAFTVILLLLVLVASIAIQRFGLLTNSMRELVMVQAQNANMAQQLYQQSQASALDLLQILQSEQRDERVPLYQSMDVAIAKADQALERLKASIRIEDMIRPVIVLRQNYKHLFNITVETLEIEGLESARNHYASVTKPVLNQLLDASQTLDMQQRAQMQNKVTALQRVIDSAFLQIVVLGIVALLIGLTLAVLVARSITRPLNTAVSFATTVADGHYEAANPQSSIKELQQLFTSLVRMRDSILQREQRISRLAYEDTLTGLANRTRFLEGLTKAIEQGPGSLVILNINRFSLINQALGHKVGDEILRLVAERLVTSSTPSSCTARLDSDKYAMIFADNDSSALEAQIFPLLEYLRQPIEVQGQWLDLDIRVGISRFPTEGTATTHLLKLADQALQLAKSHHVSFAYAMETEQPSYHEQLSMLGEMQQALNAGDFFLEYQPKVLCRSGSLMGVEALLRWQHPDKGRIPPDAFIPFAEGTGFIRNITPWVIEQAIADAQHWATKNIDLVVSLNISALDLASPDLTELIEQTLNQHQLKPQQLCLEITESALMLDPAMAQAHLQRLSSLGVKLSIDDYGTGQASLAYVKDLPVNELKIDRSFITDVEQNAKQGAIVSATILMCQNLGLQVVAEGVETEAEIQWLKDHHCQVLQGYAIAKPMRAEALTEWAEDNSDNGSSARQAN